MIVTTVLIVFFVWLVVLSYKTHALRQVALYSLASIVQVSLDATNKPSERAALKKCAAEIKKLLK